MAPGDEVRRRRYAGNAARVRTALVPDNVAEAPEVGAANVTVIPANAFMFASVTFACNGEPNCVPTVACCAPPPAKSMCAGGLGNASLLTKVSPEEETVLLPVVLKEPGTTGN